MAMASFALETRGMPQATATRTSSAVSSSLATGKIFTPSSPIFYLCSDSETSKSLQLDLETALTSNFNVSFSPILARVFSSPLVPPLSTEADFAPVNLTSTTLSESFGPPDPSIYQPFDNPSPAQYTAFQSAKSLATAINSTVPFAQPTEYTIVDLFSYDRDARHPHSAYRDICPSGFGEFEKLVEYRSKVLLCSHFLSFSFPSEFLLDNSAIFKSWSRESMLSRSGYWNRVLRHKHFASPKLPHFHWKTTLSPIPKDWRR